MGHPDGAHTRGSGRSGFGELIVPLIAVAVFGPAVAAAGGRVRHRRASRIATPRALGPAT
jgi:hypothetical protein